MCVCVCVCVVGGLSTSMTFTTPLNISAELKSVQKPSPVTSTSCSSAQKGPFGLITAWYFETQHCTALYLHCTIFYHC